MRLIPWIGKTRLLGGCREEVDVTNEWMARTDREGVHSEASVWVMNERSRTEVEMGEEPRCRG